MQSVHCKDPNVSGGFSDSPEPERGPSGGGTPGCSSRASVGIKCDSHTRTLQARSGHEQALNRDPATPVALGAGVGDDV